jgi:hypothetical protein
LLELERVSDQSRDSEHDVPVGHRGADLVGDEGALDERAALMTGRAEAALLAGKRAKEFMAAVGAVEAGEASVEIAAVEEGADGGVLKSDLKLPDAVYHLLSTYLLLAIGLKGGVQLAQAAPTHVALPALATLGLGAGMARSNWPLK